MAATPPAEDPTRTRGGGDQEEEEEGCRRRGVSTSSGRRRQDYIHVSTRRRRWGEPPALFDSLCVVLSGVGGVGGRFLLLREGVGRTLLPRTGS